MAHDHHADLQGQAAETLWIPVPLAATGVVIGDLTALYVSTNAAEVVDPVTDLSLALTEVEPTNQPGVYFLSLVPDTAGTTFIRFTHGGFDFEYTIGVAEPAYSDTALEGDYTVTAEDGVGAVAGATVTVYDAAGTKLIQRGTSDGSGDVTFYGLPIGNYQARAHKDGVDFSGINPTTITVVATDDEAPFISELLPSTFSIGDYIVILGRFFSPDSTMVLFGAEATVAPASVNAAGTAILVLVPGGLTNTIIPMRVSKPGILYSNIATAVRT